MKQKLWAFKLLAVLMLFFSVKGWGQATLPLTRTVWNSTPTGWTDTPLDSYTTSFACSGDNGAKFDTTNDIKIVNLDSSPDKLSFVVKSNLNNSTSTLLVQESDDNVTYTTVISLTGAVGLPTTCSTKGDYQLKSSTRFVKWTFTKGTSNMTMDDVSITKLASTCTAPSTQASAFTATPGDITANMAQPSWTRGNGTAGVLVVAREGSAVNADPVSGTSYTANATFGSGAQIGTGNYVVYNGTGTTDIFSGLTPNTVYHFGLYEYNTTDTCYNTTELTGNLTTKSNAPTVAAATSVTSSGFTANWSAPSGQGSATYTYTLQYSNDNTFTTGVTEITGISSATLSQSISGLIASTNYYYRVKAVNAGGDSDWSGTQTATTTAALPIINIKGNSTTIVDGDNTPSTTDHTDFGSITAGGSVTRTFTIENTGSADLHLDPTPIVFAGAGTGYSITQPLQLTLAPAATTTFSIEFTSNTLGTYTETVMVGSDASNTNTYSFDIKIVVADPSAYTFRSKASGNWNATSTWEMSSDMSAWSDAIVVPSSGSNVFIQSDHTVTLTQNESCKDLHIARGNATPNTAKGIIELDAFTLNVNGKLRTYYANVGSVPGTSYTSGFNSYPFTATTGKVSIVGDSRDLTLSGEWGATINTPATGIFPLEINLNTGQTVNLNTAIKVTSLAITAGTLNVNGNFAIGLDNGTTGQGDVTIASGATLRSAATDNVLQRSASNRAGTLNLNGTLVLTGASPEISMNTLNLSNGTVEYAQSGSTNLLTATNSGATPNTYGGLTISNTASVTQTLPSVTASNLTVNSGASFTIGANAITVITSANNNGTITVSDNGNFVQQLGSTYAGLGTLTLSKNSTSTTNIFDLWSSPVASQGMDDIFVTDGSLVREYLTATDTYAAVSPTAAFGKGYAVRGTGTDVVANFTGTPNNGTNTFTLNNTLSSPGNNRYNLVGNPYPSNFNLITFYNANLGDGSTTGIDPTMYFYNSSAVTDKWGTFNATAGGTWARANAATTETSVKPGQAFFVSARSASTTVSFDNSMRNAAAAVFVNKAATSTTEGKYWLELTTPNNNTTGFAVTYGYGASNNYDLYDSKTMSTGTDAFYTYLGTEKLAIQGRDYFVSTDVVTLGNKHSVAGQYTISLADKIGLFTNGQPIYLHDKHLGTYTDLQTSNYIFTTSALEQQDRFDIVYQTQALGTSENVKAETKVYRDGEFFVVEATEKITSIEVYDASGRLVLTQQPNRNNARILLSAKGMYVINIKTVKTETSKKVIK